jgi:hypothetical protein
MNRPDYNLIAAVLREAISNGTARPALAMRLAETFVRRGDRAPNFALQDFLDRCVPPKQKSELGKIDPGKTAPLKKERAVQVEDDASLFAAILATEYPHLKGAVGCALSPRFPNKFSIGRLGGKVWIRFGKPALIDPVSAVRQAAPDAEAMLSRKSSAREIIGR